MLVPLVWDGDTPRSGACVLAWCSLALAHGSGVVRSEAGGTARTCSMAAAAAMGIATTIGGTLAPMEQAKDLFE